MKRYTLKYWLKIQELAICKAVRCTDSSEWRRRTDVAEAISKRIDAKYGEKAA